HILPSTSLMPPFFVYCSGALLSLHSFPTRRSSDLKMGESLARLGIVKPSVREVALGMGIGLVLVVLALGLEYIASFFGILVDPEDRKSTRLNSSHVKISYAVFCLKKKTNLIMFYLL